MMNGTALRPGRARALEALAVCLLLAAHIPASRAQHPPAPAGAADRGRLELVEDLSESLANDLIDLSLALRDRDLKGAADFIAPRIDAAPFPRRPRPAGPQLKWAVLRRWEDDAGVAKARGMTFAKPYAGARTAVRPTSREEFIRGLSGFLANFAVIEDVRLAVAEANFADAASSTSITTGGKTSTRRTATSRAARCGTLRACTGA